MVNRFLSVFCLWLAFGAVHAQEAKLISYTAIDKPLSEIFDELQAQYDLNFNYSLESIEGLRGDVNANEMSLDLFLTNLLTPLYLDFELVDHNYLIIKDVFTINLKVMAVDSEEVLPFANVSDSSLSKGGATNGDGLIQLSLQRARHQVLKISYVGYEPLTVSLDSVPFENPLVFRLRPSANQLDELIVQEYLNKGVVVDQQGLRNVIFPQEMKVLPGLAEPDILLSAQMLPGINSADESASGINVRGSARDQTFYHWNDIPIYHQAHYFGNISAIIPSTVGAVHIYKNQIPSKYGGASSGLVNIFSRENQDSLTAEINMNLTHADVYAQTELPKNSGNLLIGARRSYNDLFLTPTYNSVTEKVFDGSTTALYQDQITENSFDYNSRVTFSDVVGVYSLDREKNEYQVSGFHSRSIMDFDSRSDDELGRVKQRNNLKSYGLGGKWSHDWSSNLNTELTGFWSDYELYYSLRTADYFNEREYLDSRDNSLKNYSVRLDNGWVISRKIDASIGVQWNKLRSKVAYFSDEQSPDVDESYFDEEVRSSHLTAVYASLNFVPMDRMQLEGSVRQSFYQYSHRQYTDPQIKATYQLSDHLSLKATAGIYHQFLSATPEVQFILTNFSEQLWQLSDMHQVITNHQVSGGFLFDKNEWIVDVEVYRKDLNNLDARRLYRLADTDWTGAEKIVGMDLLVKKKLEDLTLWTSYAFQQSTADVPAIGEFDFPSQLNARHQLQLGLAYEVKAFEFSSGYSFKSGLPYTYASGLNLVEAGEETYYQPDYQRPNGRRLPPYHRWDVSAWYRFLRNPKKMQGQLGFSIINLTNRRNVYNRAYSAVEVQEGEYRLASRDIAIYGFTPNLSVRLKF